MKRKRKRRRNRQRKRSKWRNKLGYKTVNGMKRGKTKGIPFAQGWIQRKTDSHTNL